MWRVVACAHAFSSISPPTEVLDLARAESAAASVPFQASDLVDRRDAISKRYVMQCAGVCSFVALDSLSQHVDSVQTLKVREQ